MVWTISNISRRLAVLGRSNTKKSYFGSLRATSSLSESNDEEKNTKLQKKEAALTETKQHIVHRKDHEIIVRERYIGIGDENDIIREDPGEKVGRIIRYDYHCMKESLMRTLGITYEEKSSKYTYGTIDTDILVIGGGSIGSSIAYWFTKLAPGGIRVLVIERDMTHQTSAVNVAMDGLHLYFSQPECVEMSLFCSDFLRSMARDLKVEGLPDPNPNFVPCGHLALATEEEADDMVDNAKMQNSLGVKNVLLSSKRLGEWFPWLNTNGLALGCLGLGREGWFDPWMLMLGMKTKAMRSGAEFEDGEVIGFSSDHPGENLCQFNYRSRSLRSAVVRRPSGETKMVSFSSCVIAAGADSGYVAKLAGIGIGEGVLRMPLPIERRKRYLYHVRSPNGPCMNVPMTHFPENVSFRREGLFGDYVAAVSPEPDQEPSSSLPTVDGAHYHDRTSSRLGARVPAFANAKLNGIRAGFYEHNPIDMHGVIGFHPLLSNVMFACGFDGSGNQHAPAIGRAVAEFVFNGRFTTIDLSRFDFSRFARSGSLLRANSGEPQAETLVSSGGSALP